MKRNDREFKKLQKQWYDKLADDGFVDIEDTSNAKRLLKEWDSNFFRNKFEAVRYDTTSEYYYLASQLLQTYRFKTETHRRIWEMHCQGMTERKIAEIVIEYKKSTVHNVIAEISRLIKKDD